MTSHILLLCLLLLFSVMAVMAEEMLMSAVYLGAASVALTLLLYEMYAPWAAVFELSVCAGLITVLFISAISLVRQEESFIAEPRLRFKLLPVWLFMAGILLSTFGKKYLAAFQTDVIPPPQNEGVGLILWHLRTTDIIGQLCMFLAGVLIINSFFSRRKA